VLYKTAIKRALDIFIASISLLLLFPLVLIAAVCVKVDSPGPIIFRQTRVGQFGRSFTMLKLRTMVQEAEQGGARWAVKSDTRITRVGKFLRRSRIDEIPQLLNVLAGEMSLVGPRPERPEFTPTLESRIPFFVYRLLVKPGVTGWAQVNAGYAATEAEAATKLSFDLYYVKNLSFGLDLRVLLRTISSFTNGSR
jgi:lipopolysaccharide/colanic/teichoic acid biosynthesis glycosyltransferase